MSEKNKNTLDIECPHCKQTIPGTIKNKTNNTTLIITALASASVAAILADKHIVPSEIIALVGSSAGTLIYTYRLKIETEYKIMKTCIDRFGSNTIVRDGCFCSVKKLSTYLNSQIAKIRGENWLSNKLDEEYNKCTGPKQISSQTND